MRILMYSPDSIGLGHMRRNATIAAEVVRQAPHASVAMLIGSGAGAFFAVPKGVDTIKLPSVQKVASETWVARSLNLSVHETARVRAGIVRNVVRTLKPDLLLADHLPMGVCGDLAPALEMIRRERLPTCTVLGLRDILDEPQVICRRWQAADQYRFIADNYERILIYGDGAVYPTGKLYGLEACLPDAVTYTGYVCSMPCAAARRPLDVHAVTALAGLSAWQPGERILVAAGGGGHDAFPSLSATLQALRLLDGDTSLRAVVIAGPLMPEAERRRLAEAARGLTRTWLLPWTTDCMDYLGIADVAVVMAGYNSALEALSTTARIIMMPRPGPSAEQRIRADLLAHHGHVSRIDAGSATTAEIARSIRGALDAPPRQPAHELLGGAARAAQVLIELCERVPAHVVRASARQERSPYVLF